MKKIFFILSIAILIVVGFGCQSQTLTTNPIQSKTETTPVAPINVITGVEIVPAGDWVLPTTCEKIENNVAIQTVGEMSDSFKINLGNKTVKEVKVDGEHSMAVIGQMLGMAFVALDPSGLGGYIPYGLNHEVVYGVDLCSGAVIEAENVSSISDNGVLLARVSDDNDKQVKIEIETFGEGRSPFTTPKEWIIPGEWQYIGNVHFFADSSKLAFAVANGPDVENSVVYVLDLTSGKFTEQASKDDGHLYVDGWTASGEVIYR
jgi:hypothetical protein